MPFVSQVETGFAAPSLLSLFAIARVLETTPERLLAGPTSDQVTLTRHGQGPAYAVTDSELSARRWQLTALGEPFSGAEYQVHPGGDLGGWAAWTGRELIHVTSGRLDVDVVLDDGREVTYELAAGDTLVYSTSARHRWRHGGGRSTTALRPRPAVTRRRTGGGPVGGHP